MKRAFAAFVVLGLLLSLAGCVRFGTGLLGAPETVKIDGEKYRTGFYADDLWLDELSYTGEEYEVRGILFQRAEGSGFSFLRAKTGSKTGGVLYCLDSQWQDAKDYYADSANYAYYCLMGAAGTDEEDQIFEIPDADVEKWEALTKHGGVFDYNPFDMLHNKAAEYREITIDIKEFDPRPYIRFYRASRDGVFISYKGHRFFLMDGKLYLARYQNLSEEKVAAVEVPEETGEYFAELVEELLEE